MYGKFGWRKYFCQKKYRKAKEATNTFANSIQSKIDITLNLFWNVICSCEFKKKSLLLSTKVDRVFNGRLRLYIEIYWKKNFTKLLLNINVGKQVKSCLETFTCIFFWASNHDFIDAKRFTFIILLIKLSLCFIQKKQTGFRCNMYFSFYSLAHVQQADCKSDSCFLSICAKTIF